MLAGIMINITGHCIVFSINSCCRKYDIDLIQLAGLFIGQKKSEGLSI